MQMQHQFMITYRNTERPNSFEAGCIPRMLLEEISIIKSSTQMSDILFEGII